jgi:hypothetical protein
MSLVICLVTIYTQMHGSGTQLRKLAELLASSQLRTQDTFHTRQPAFFWTFTGRNQSQCVRFKSKRLETLAKKGHSNLNRVSTGDGHSTDQKSSKNQVVETIWNILKSLPGLPATALLAFLYREKTWKNMKKQRSKLCWSRDLLTFSNTQQMNGLAEKHVL